MNVVKLVRPDTESQRTLEILTELLELAKAGHLVGLTYIAEVRGDRRQKFGALGTFSSDPQRGLGSVGRLSAKLSQAVEAEDAAYK